MLSAVAEVADAEYISGTHHFQLQRSLKKKQTFPAWPIGAGFKDGDPLLVVAK